ncbi:hypothetical protein [Pedobacter sp. B4-66]|uniref:hypothetical protein n=1 Tax=Pedobacter sp. B4-66 TaxID=2817280 RepID=UPI001BD915A5|nr:hypothetical protein [Pedobacter sp. B4-66]
MIRLLPNAVLFGFPLLIIAANPLEQSFAYKKEMIIFFIASFFLYILGYQDMKYFFVVITILVFCCCYFNYVIGSDLLRFNISIIIFYALLSFSSFVMVLNHHLPTQIDRLRSMLIGGELILQSPSGITANVFSFGYQIAALTSFAIIATTIFKQKKIVLLLVLGVSGYVILYGMNRSALVAVGCAVMFFWMLYYRFKVVIIFGLLAALAFGFRTTIEELSSGRKQNILSKNERGQEGNREDLMAENIKILADNPYGLIFEGKTWDEVAGRNPVFKIGAQGLVTSHNAYLMFVTYLGVVVGGILLFFIYQKIVKITWFAIHHLRDKDYALLVCLCFSFMAISINALFHNEWLLGSGCGPTLFLYFSVLHLYNIKTNNADLVKIL